MPLLIDCYNVLHQTMPAALAGLDEGGLCVAVARRFPGQKAVIVCDGQPKPGQPSQSPVDGVDLRYTGRGGSADALIIRLIDEDSAPRRLRVVSSDREIQKAARRRGAKVVESGPFAHELAQRSEGSGGGRSGGGSDRPATPDRLSPDEVQRWIERFGLGEGGEGKPRR
ncbi:MAG: NYN domain-containing protein [Planctomycetota bacterium]|nr:NYN domain-containing protein [Planctomycetota bacterium]